MEKLNKTYYYFGDDSSDKIECRNTYKLQLTSLLLFASTVGYAYNPLAETDGDNFIYVGDNKTGFSIVSFNTMRDWYNTCFMYDKPYHHGLEVELPKVAKQLRLPLESMQAAIEGKLTKRVYLQSGKGKWLSVQKHLVEIQE